MYTSQQQVKFYHNFSPPTISTGNFKMAYSGVVEFPHDEDEYVMNTPLFPICKIDLSKRALSKGDPSKGDSSGEDLSRLYLIIRVQIPPKFYVAIWSEKRAIVGMIPVATYDTSGLTEFLEEANRYLDSGQEHTIVIVRTSRTSNVNAIHWDAFFHHISTQRKEDKIEVVLHDPEMVDNPPDGANIPDSEDGIRFVFWDDTLGTTLGRLLDDGRFMKSSAKTLTYGKRDTNIVLPSVEDGKTGTRGIFRGEYIPVLLEDEAAPLRTSHSCMDGTLASEMATLDDLVFFVAGRKSCIFRVPIEWTTNEIIKSLLKLAKFCFSSMNPADQKDARVLCCHPRHLSEDGKKRGTDRAKAIEDTTRPWVREGRWGKSEYPIEGISYIALTPRPSHPEFSVYSFV
jgi:hypothetical protein